MLAVLIAVLVWFAGIAFTIYVIRTYFPNLPAIVHALIVAAITLAIGRALHQWVCGWLCAP